MDAAHNKNFRHKNSLRSMNSKQKLITVDSKKYHTGNKTSKNP